MSIKDHEENLEEDIEIENEEEIENPQLLLKKLREKLKVCQEERQNYLTGWQKEKADFINTRKRDDEEKRKFLEFAKEDLILQIIPVVDSFDLSMKNKESWESLPKDWRIGMESIANQLLGILGQNGVTKTSPLGELFDPNLHDAVQMVPVGEKKQDHTIVDVLQAGFSINNKIIRPAKVRVGEYHE